MAKKPQSDFAATDDLSPVPVAPMAEVAPVIEQDQQVDDTEDAKLAQAYWHPAWEKVQKLFENKLEAYDGNNVAQFKDLEPMDFKARVLANQIIYGEIKSIMEDVQRAVESVGSQPKPGKQPKSGT